MKKAGSRPHKKRSHRLEYLVINIFVFAGIGLLSFFVFNVSLFNQFTQAFKDFTVTDMCYSRKIINQDSVYNGPLVLINIEDKSREELSYLLQRIEEGKPKVVALDIIFTDKKKDTGADGLLKQTLGGYKNIVYPYIASFGNAATETHNNEYFKIPSEAFINIYGEDKNHATTRYYFASYSGMPAFTTAVIRQFDPVKGNELLKRKQQKTEIRYFGDQQNFHYFNFEEVLNPSFNTDTLKDKIVLLGYMGLPGNTINNPGEDRLFTPLNKQLSGRSLPDMYGTVVLANILRMELDNDYIYAFPVWLNWLLAFVFSWALLPLFVRWYVHKAVWFHLFTIVLQLCISMGFVFLSLGLYANFNLKIESSAVLVSILLIGDFLLLYDHLVKFFRYKLKWNFNSVFFGHEH